MVLLKISLSHDDHDGRPRDELSRSDSLKVKRADGCRGAIAGEHQRVPRTVGCPRPRVQVTWAGERAAHGLTQRKKSKSGEKKSNSGPRALLPATRSQSSGQLGALLSSPVLGVRQLTALQVLQVPCNNAFSHLFGLCYFFLHPSPFFKESSPLELWEGGTLSPARHETAAHSCDA